MVRPSSNVQACREFSMNSMDRWKNIPFSDLLALANAASVEVEHSGNNGPLISALIPTSSSQIDSDPQLLLENQRLLSGANHRTNGNYDRDKPEFSHRTIPEFAPITPDKATSGKSNKACELQNSCADDRTNQERKAKNNDIAADRVDSNIIQYKEDPLNLATYTSVAAASSQFMENYDSDKGESHVIGLNKTPRHKARRKKHRPKVVKEGSKTSKPGGSKENQTGKRKYTRKNGLNKDSTSSTAEAPRESIDQKTFEPTKESCRETLNFDIGQLTEEKYIYKSAPDLVSESEMKDFHARHVQSKSTIQLSEETEVAALKPVTPKPTGSKENPTGKRKYVLKKGLIKSTMSSPTEAARGSDLKALEPMELCRKTFSSDMEQPRDENSTCKSTYPKQIPTGKTKYVRKNRLNKYLTSSLTEVAVEYNDLRMFEPTRKSCRRALNFDIEGQHRDEESSCNLDSESQENDFYRRGMQSKEMLQLSEGIELTLENTQVGIAYDLTCLVNQMPKDYMSLPERQKPIIPLPTETSLQQPKGDAGFRKENDGKGRGQGTDNTGQEHSRQIIKQIDTQTSPRIPNESICNMCPVLIEQRHARESKRKYSNPIEQAEASSSNLVGVRHHTLQTYQIPCVPKIKKKKTEKGKNSTMSSTSSSVTAVKDVTLETTRFQGDTKADSSASKTNNLISASQSNASCIATAFRGAGSGLQDKQKTFECLLALNPTERLTKKRSRALTRVRDLASQTRIAFSTTQPTYPSSQGPQDCNKQQVGSSEKPHKCIEELVEETRKLLAQKKRTKKRNSLVNSASSGTNETQKQHNSTLYSHQQFSGNALGTLPDLRLTHMFCIDAIIDQFSCLEINGESSHIEHQEMNALVLYSRDGTIVPVHSAFDLVKKRRPRPKVELDEETNRVWKLLLENVNSEGIDGTNEENIKWWEEERRVFHGRVDSFIARMHLVQGDRRFSQWKGSVVESVVGVFLTQNVSDHLSSSAYMSLAAQFPLKSKNQQPCYGEGASSMTKEPVPYVLDPEETVDWAEKTTDQPACDQSSMTLHNSEHNGEKEVVSSNESFGSSTVSLVDESKCKLLNSCVSVSEKQYDSTVNRSPTERSRTETICFKEGKIATKDVLSSQNSLISSQNSMDSSFAQSAQRNRSSFATNSEVGDLNNGTKFNNFNDCSFVELLLMAGSNKLHQLCNHGNGDMTSDENSKNEHQQFQTMEHENQSQKVEDLGGPNKYLGVSDISSSSSIPYLTQDSAVEVERYEILREETGSSGTFMNNNKTCVTEQSAVTPQFASETADATNLTICIQEAPRSPKEKKETRNSKQGNKNIIAQHQSELYQDFRLVGTLAQVKKNEMKHLNLLNLSGETSDSIGSSIAYDKQENTQQQTSVSDLNMHEWSFSKKLNEINDATTKLKGRTVRKDKKNDFDWDSLRRQVEANGREKERPENTMDSLDWEAVRCADVNKIADTIKARGMNNKLAERIKDFLNRLVREHGSIDLEWLRDIPPDKAKEYLLSIRGLGLKSVECVRLLTLHHLAFPVDTNVGRIAVRLGWVPLQPLPESLQLHLLELYPVLESIQKYLWPRLCKLDQRTLYELHYQMITFGKVFCTKSKPNCNACPMRGECRHFASAFASSRLALPGPEEISIVSAEESRTSDTNPAVIVNQLPLPLPQATEKSKGNHQSETKSEVNNCEPIIEEPATPEPECTQKSETDIEDIFCENPDEIPTIKLNMEEFSQNLQNYMQDNMELQEGDMSKALVASTAEVASIPMPKLKNVSRLRTEHQVYELPDSHPLLEGLEKREPDDPGRYLLAIWTPGETANSIQPPERSCGAQEHGKLCNEKTCFSCNSVRESQSHIVRGTLLIPCRTAMRGSFPLNGTYFQVNEVFADHDSSLNPINVPREWIWNLPRRTVYFGTSIPTIFKGLTTEGIQHCFWRGYVCVRGFDQKTRAPRPLMSRLHFPASKLSKTHGKADADDT